MNHFRKIDKKISFINKIRISYGLLIAIPILILEIFVLYSSTNFIKEQQLIESNEVIERNYQDIQSQIMLCEKSLLYLVSNNTLKEFMNTSDEEYLKRAKEATNVSSLLYNTLLSNQYFKKMEIYSDKNFAVNTAIFKNNDECKKIELYEERMNSKETLWLHEDGKNYMLRRIVVGQPEREVGIIKIEITDEIFSKGLTVFDNIPISVQVIENNNVYFEYNNSESNKETSQYYSTIKSIDNTTWDILYAINTAYFSNIFHPQILWSFVVVVLLLIIGLLAVNYSTKSLMKYLYRLIHDVKKVKENHFEIDIEDYSQDEIGELASSINKMLEKIQFLIDKIYKSEIEKKNLELDLLQSKMNPHFLYNNLSAINWIAIEKGEDRIYEITTELATFYRTALNKGYIVDKLEIEIENIKSYIKLQMMAHDDDFEIEYFFEPQLMEHEIPMFIMQPLVENAIEHGIDTLRGAKGHLSISIMEEKQDIIIKIMDNGQKLLGEIGEKKMEHSKYGYGISNVHRRIQLLCGEGYGVEITASTKGTLSTIKLRKELAISDEDIKNLITK